MINNEYHIGHGKVQGFWVAGAHKVPAVQARHNQLSYSFADAVARTFAGDIAYAPRYIGFIYGSNATVEGLDSPTLRNQSWDNIAENLADIRGNIQISGLSTVPAVSIDGDAEIYDGNSVMFSAHTHSGNSGIYGFPVGGVYASKLTSAEHYLYHAVLLARNESTADYIPLARVTLADKDTGEYHMKPAGFELSLEWRITFN